MKASDLQPGMRLTGTLPPVKGIRTEYADPIVDDVRVDHGWLRVTWIDGTEANFYPDEDVELAKKTSDWWA